MKLSVLDFGSRVIGQSPGDAVATSLRLAELADQLGYFRFWIAEHHEAGGHTAPEVLIGVVAGLTERIRVGAAGVLLSFYSPFKVAEVFRLHSLLYPGRIDLGIARGLAMGPLAALLGDGRPVPLPPDVFYARAAEAIAFARGEREPVPHPKDVAPPDAWVMGHGENAVDAAARCGASLSLSLMHARTPPSPELVARYREKFVPHPLQREPRCNVAVAGLCAESSAEARELTRENAGMLTCNVAGDPAECADALHAVAERYRVDEIVFKDLDPTGVRREKCFELLAKACGLQQAPG